MTCSRYWELKIPFKSSEAGTSVLVSISTTGALGRGALVDVFERTFGQPGAFVSAPRRPRSSLAEVLLLCAAAVTLRRLRENPGPFSEVSNVPVKIFVGLISQLASD